VNFPLSSFQSMGSAIDLQYSKHRFPLSPPSSGSATSHSSPQFKPLAALDHDDTEIVERLLAHSERNSSGGAAGSESDITQLKQGIDSPKSSRSQPARNAGRRALTLPTLRLSLAEMPRPPSPPITTCTVPRMPTDSSSPPPPSPYTHELMAPPPTTGIGRKVAASLQLFKETAPSDEPITLDPIRPDGSITRRVGSSSKTKEVAEAQFEFVKRSEWPDRESVTVRREKTTSAGVRTRDSSTQDADSWRGKERRLAARDVPLNDMTQWRKDMLARQDHRGRRLERVTDELVSDVASPPKEWPLSTSSIYKVREHPRPFQPPPNSRPYPPSPSPSRSPPTRVPSSRHISTPTARSSSLLSLPSELSTAPSHRQPGSPISIQPTSEAPLAPPPAFTSSSPWSTDDESSESGSVATSTSTTSADSSFPLSPPPSSFHSPSLRLDSEDENDERSDFYRPHRPVEISGSELEGFSEVEGRLHPDQEFSTDTLPHIPLRPFPNQVGGHKAIYKFTKRAVCKVSTPVFAVHSALTR
jgi:inositol-hexakisphosphate 5-kinase